MHTPHTHSLHPIDTMKYIVYIYIYNPYKNAVYNAHHTEKREAFRCLAIRLQHFSLERTVCYLTYKMFYDCLIWSILTLFIIRSIKATVLLHICIHSIEIHRNKHTHIQSLTHSHCNAEGMVKCCMCI